MGISKTILFTAEQNTLARLAKGLAHPARIAILEYLLDSNTCCNSNLVAELGLAQATVSQHLRELKDLGLIQGTISGNTMNYCIHPEGWREASDLLIHFLGRSPFPSTCSTTC
ncbi:transcriptional regulator, arsr family protein [Nitritalea halalkaliphila LW7]|uniref:Transcriptional regulator, arsr family protein n=1 Tax=Nitritalea halalkaliphila LW7 TaxID=1189621 RepID=I5C5K7_9BACT|nr:metalloregulator ArsR/SmtB family transcription factor [Nitritalea halalkaliphila]EIM77109.1 transcriptional regulator, arsr family protein [Nitritalea halalkaliphila LW7]